MPKPMMIAEIFGWDASWVPALRLNVSGGFDWKKISLRKSVIAVDDTEFTVSGDWDWSVAGSVINANIRSPHVDLMQLFPKWYVGGGTRPKRALNVFKDVPLFGTDLLGRTAKVHLELGNLIVYRDLNIQDIDLSVDLRENHARIDLGASVADGSVDVGIDADIDDDGRYRLQ